MSVAKINCRLMALGHGDMVAGRKPTLGQRGLSFDPRFDCIPRTRTYVCACVKAIESPPFREGFQWPNEKDTAATGGDLLSSSTPVPRTVGSGLDLPTVLSVIGQKLSNHPTTHSLPEGSNRKKGFSLMCHATTRSVIWGEWGRKRAVMFYRLRQFNSLQGGQGSRADDVL